MDDGTPVDRFEDDSARQELEALGRVVLAFRGYERDAYVDISRWENSFRRLPSDHMELLQNQVHKFMLLRLCVDVNQNFFNTLLQSVDEDREGSSSEASSAAALTAWKNVMTSRGMNPFPLPPAEDAEAAYRVPRSDVDRVRYVMKNMVRDWSSEGAEERKSYELILNQLKSVFADWPDMGVPPRVLIPGAGLGRLCCEVAGLGYEAQGNEFSYMMLLASSFILNHSDRAEQFTIHPWIHSSCNNLSNADQLRPVTVPDVQPGEIVKGAGLLSMSAGDFVEVYSTPAMESTFDCVVTCFFIDTAHNVLQYLDVMAHCLKPGGKWINLGPLLYHWAENFTPSACGGETMSLEISMEDILRVAGLRGFKLDHMQEGGVQAPYMANSRSMLRTQYQASFFTMTLDPDYDSHPNADTLARSGEDEVSRGKRMGYNGSSSIRTLTNSADLCDIWCDETEDWSVISSN
eukprot:gene9788-7673_t